LVQVKLDDKSFVLASLKLDLQENVGLDLIFAKDVEVTFSVVGKNPIQLVGYFIDEDIGAGGDLDDLDDEELDSGELDFDEDDEDEIDEEELNKATLQALAGGQKRKAEQPQNGVKKAKTDQTPPAKPEQQPKAGQAPKGEQTPKGQQQQKKEQQKPQTPKADQKQPQQKSPAQQQQKSPAQQQQKGSVNKNKK
jgi:hypothetical protein